MFKGSPEISKTIMEINDLRGFAFPDSPFTSSHSQLSPGLGSIKDDEEISANIMKINDLRDLARPSSSLLGSSVASSGRLAGELQALDADKPAKRTRWHRLGISASFLSSRLGAGRMLSCLITATIMAQT